jgi:hypothetical protein
MGIASARELAVTERENVMYTGVNACHEVL